MNIVVIQPPLVQLNTAYPSGAYLSSFFKNLGHTVKWFDFSIELFHEIFSRKGLTKLFELSENSALEKAQAALKQNDAATYSNIMAYLSMSSAWIEWIDVIVEILKDGTSESTRELCHRFIFSPDVPRGARMISYMENLSHELSTDDARFLATMALADLSDYITAVFDKEFALIRYGESITVNENTFAQIEKSVSSPILENFYAEVLNHHFLKDDFTEKENFPSLVCISIPFAGTFTAALFTGKFFKEHFGSKVFVSAGGGFINTELRECNEKSLYKYFNALSYDRGYGSYKSLFDSKILTLDFNDKNNLPESLYKMRLFTEEKIFPQNEDDDEVSAFEDKITASTIPDFSDIDFSLYPRMCDDTNPMQRLWSDGAWLKVYLAHGCYWHKCAFCDTTLDYVKSYRLTNISSLYKNIRNQCEQKKIWGLHFVDEAMPLSAARQFAFLNSQSNKKISFWGNVRFEKTYTRDIADFLSYGGLSGVSGGIEIATGSGLDSINKGTDLDSIVSACCAFKEAGILIHAYMIFGYWAESNQDLINSMETLRQMYECGILDSSFWHKFVLTRHSRIYSEWKNGMHGELKPIEIKNSGIFAKNALHFAGEEKSEKFSQGLNLALQSWMHGENLNKSVNKWFNFKTPAPTVPKDLIEKSIARYELNRDKQFSLTVDLTKAWWLGGKIFAAGNVFTWTYKGELLEEKIPDVKDKNLLNDFACVLFSLKPELFAKRENAIRRLSKLTEASPALKKTLTKLRGQGLCIC